MKLLPLKCLHSYYIGSLFHCCIYEDSTGYVYSIFLDKEIEVLGALLTYELARIVKKTAYLRYITSFHDFIVEMRKLVEKRVEKKLEKFGLHKKLKDKALETFIKYVTYRCIGFQNLIPVLLDNNVDEIYLDTPFNEIYIDHQHFGRLKVYPKATMEEVEKLLFISKFESDHTVSYENPSLKTVLLSPDFKVRVAVDFPPLCPQGPSIDIRRLREKPLPPTSWLRKRADLDFLSFLITSLAMRPNIVIVGEPGSGKTSLLIFLLALLPDKWRIVAIEDTREIPNLTPYGKRIVYIKVKPFEAERVQYSKEKEIIKLLHRSPDYVAIGELQSKADNLAFFHALSAGIRGMGTIHATSIDELFDRWINIFHIKSSLIKNLDIIVFMKKIILHKKILRGLNDIILHIDQANLSKGVRFDLNINSVHKTIAFWQPFRPENSKVYIQALINKRIKKKNSLPEKVNLFQKYQSIIREELKSSSNIGDERKFFITISRLLSELHDALYS